ncbi:MAG TPA: hypothetical protein VIL74_16620 [Pyrinomonadaceae bacterium]
MSFAISVNFFGFVKQQIRRRRIFSIADVLNYFKICACVAFRMFNLTEKVNVDICALRPQNACERRAVAAVVAFAAED